MIDSTGGPARSFGLPIRYLLVLAAVFAGFLAIFLVLRAFPGTALDDPTPWLSIDRLGAGLGVGLLVVDVVLPVPASLVMVGLGALFGAAAGAGLALLGSMGAALLGYGLGRWAGPSVLRRACSASERARGDELMARWGLLAVAASRPVPLLAETVAVAAGAARLGVGRTLLAATLGALPACVLFAVAGAFGLDSPSGLLVFGAALTVSFLLWLVGRRIHRTAELGEVGDRIVEKGSNRTRH